MTIFHWEPEYAIGHTEVDAQHQRIVAIMNRLYGLLTDEGCDRHAEAEHVFDELADYVSTHFAYEEALMLRIGYPTEELAEHKRAHNRLLAKVQEIMTAHHGGDASALTRLLPFLYGDWLIEHICQEDKAYATHLAVQG